MKRRTFRFRASVAVAACAGACWLSCMGSNDSNNGGELRGDSISPPELPTDDIECGAGNPLAQDCDDDESPGVVAPQDPPPEREVESSYRTPEVTGKYVWSANPDSGRVAVIDAETFEVRSADAGLGPTHIAAINQADGVARALVINTGASDATLLTVTSASAIETLTVPLHQGADSWSVSPGGRFAVAWTDSRKAERLDPTDGFQDITVIDLTSPGTPQATRLTVGYRPSEIAFNTVGNRAFAITEDGISVFDLADSGVRLAGLVPLPRRIGLQPDVSVLPDGTRALARIEGESTLFDIDLLLATTTPIELGGDLTDLDLSADGSRAVAVIRAPVAVAPPPDAGAPPAADAGSDAGADAGPAPVVFRSAAVSIPLPAGLADASLRQTFSSPAETFGSVALSRDGEHAVLFTTARPTSRVTLLGPALTARSVDLLAAVRAVFVTADGSHAIVLQDPAAGSLRKGAFSVLSLADVRAPKLVAADAPAQAVAMPPDSSDRALVTVSDPRENVFGSFLVRMPNLQVDFSGLPSRPLATGTVPSARKAFVAQAHPEGRITFIDLAEGQGREITGFELSSKVVDE